MSPLERHSRTLTDAQHSQRAVRIERMVPVCLGIIQDSIEFLCEGDDAEDDDVEEDFEVPATGWASMSNQSLLRVQQTLHAIAQSIIEFLGDARDAIKATQDASDDATASLRRTCLFCGRCLSCWLAQETGVLRKELADSKVLGFLLSLSRYSGRRLGGRGSSDSSVDDGGVASLPPSPYEDDDDDDDASLDSDDETGDAGTSTSAAAAVDDDDESSDPLYALLPAFASMCEEEEDDSGGISRLLELTGGGCSVHDVVVNFVVAELEGTVRGLVDGADRLAEPLHRHPTQRAAPLLWALGLLLRLLTRTSGAASEVISTVEDGHDGRPFHGRVVDHGCFRRVLPPLVRCASGGGDGGGSGDAGLSIRAADATNGQLVELLLNHAVSLFLVIEMHLRDGQVAAALGAPLGEAADAAVAAFLERTAEVDWQSDPMLKRARRAAGARRGGGRVVV